MSASNDTIKADRLYIRTSKAEKDRLERAATLMRTTRTQFVLQQALEAADRVLAEQTRFVLSPEAWMEFCARLDAPTRDLPNVAALAQEPSPFHGG